MTTVLESCHGITTARPQFAGVDLAVEIIDGNKYQVRRCPCGCVNFTRLAANNRGPTADGSTHLCDNHA